MSPLHAQTPASPTCRQTVRGCLLPAPSPGPGRSAQRHQASPGAFRACGCRGWRERRGPLLSLMLLLGSRLTSRSPVSPQPAQPPPARAGAIMKGATVTVPSTCPSDTAPGGPADGGRVQPAGMDEADPELVARPGFLHLDEMEEISLPVPAGARAATGAGGWGGGGGSVISAENLPGRHMMHPSRSAWGQGDPNSGVTGVTSPPFPMPSGTAGPLARSLTCSCLGASLLSPQSS